MLFMSKLKKYFSQLSISQAFGVDINNEEIKIFQIKTKKKVHEVVGWNKKLLPKGMVEDFEVKDKEGFIEIFKDAVKSSRGKRITGKNVVLSMPENKVFLRVIEVPLMSKEEVTEAIKWEVEANIPIDISEVYYDWQIVKREKETMKVLVEASSKKIIDNLTGVLEQAGFQVCVFEADSIATGRSILLKDEVDPVLIVDIGRQGTGYFIFKDGYPVLSSSGSVSGKMFTDAVSKFHGITNIKAEARKMRIGLGANKKEREEAFKVYGSILAILVQEIEKAINFHDTNLSSEEGKKVKKIIISGGGSNLKGLISYLAIHLKKQVVQGNPWQNVNFKEKIPPISKEEAQSYITVIGLALRDYSL